MKACVVYESLYGNTAAVAQAIAAGIGPEAVALPTDEATPEALASADLVVAGAPLMAFRLPTDAIRASAAEQDRADAPRTADLAHPSMRAWLASLRPGTGHAAAFETKLRWSPGGATGAIERGLEEAGFRRIAPGAKFYVKGRYGPLRAGELDRAQAWGRSLAESLPAPATPLSTA